MSEKNKISNLPVPSVGGLSIYLSQIKKFPMLDAEEEYMLAKIEGKWKFKAAILGQPSEISYKIAMGYRGYGLPVNELISEGNLD